MDTSLSNPEQDNGANLAVLMDVQLPVSIRFGETEMILEEIVKLGVGSVIELNSTDARSRISIHSPIVAPRSRLGAPAMKELPCLRIARSARACSN